MIPVGDRCYVSVTDAVTEQYCSCCRWAGSSSWHQDLVGRGIVDIVGRIIGHLAAWDVVRVRSGSMVPPEPEEVHQGLPSGAPHHHLSVFFLHFITISMPSSSFSLRRCGGRGRASRLSPLGDGLENLASATTGFGLLFRSHEKVTFIILYTRT